MEKKNKKENVEEVAKKNEKLTYEQLEQVANNLNNQCKQLYQELMETRKLLSNINDIEMLLSLVGNSAYFSSAFVDRCANKIEQVVTVMLDDSDKAIKEAENSK